MKKFLVVLAALASIAVAGCSKPQTAWITDIDAAIKESDKAGKPLLVVFTGSDWSDESRRLIDNVFNADFFKRGTKGFVMCNLDIIQDEASVDPAVLERNYKAVSEYGVQAMPAVVLVTRKGDIYGSANLDETIVDAETFFTLAEGFGEKGKTLLGLRAAIDKSKGVERAKSIDLFIDALVPSQRERYADLMREVIDIDADGSAGLKGKFVLQTTYLDAINLYQQGKLTDAGDSFFRIAKGDFLTAAQKQEAWYMGAYMYAMSESVDNELVISWLEEAIAADPENEGTGQIRATIEQIKTAPKK